MKLRLLDRIWRQHQAFHRNISSKLALLETMLVLTIALVSVLNYGRYLGK